MASTEAWNRHRSDNASECCSDFRCCTDLWREAGLVHVAEALTAAARELT